MELEPQYEPQKVEPAIGELWERSGALRSKPTGKRDANTFAIVIPPPNVTGALHLGHALNCTLQDILVRYHRMRGFNTLWQPGTDHAGIATQAVVERRIRELEGKSRHDLGREELVRRIWQWKDEYEQRILDQLKSMGCSCDWSRTAFTLDEPRARAVRHQFFNMFKDGLIFRGVRLVNWDTELQTAVANDEVYYETVQGHFWHFKYPVINPKPGEPTHVLIATTRPETMLGDTAVAVCPNPAEALDRIERKLRDDLAGSLERERAGIQAKLDALALRRRTHLELLTTLSNMARDGRKILLPLVEREIPLIADEWADPLLGSGCVKITPAHDPNDYEVALRHKLPMINVLKPDGKVAPIVEPDGKPNPHSHAYAGLPFSTEARKRVVADLEARGFLAEIEDRDTEIGHSDRSKTPIEPFLSIQWFVRTSDIPEPGTDAASSNGIQLGDGSTAPGLAQAAMDAVNNNRINISPKRYSRSYVDWLAEKRDWCISRQLWWGHRVPVLIRELAIGDDLRSKVYSWEDEGCIAVLDPTWVHERHSDAELTQPEYWYWYVAVRDADSDEILTELHRHDFVQDPDVLDTWFSSALWPFSTLGWPDETPHLRQYYPGSVLITSRDIITNWVARMVMFGLYATGKVPFDHVYIHPKILDGRGETMSKSKGNGVDPLDIIKTHGADALRYAMADMTTETQDIRMPVEYVCPHCEKLVDQAYAIKAEQQRRKSRGEKLDRKLQPADCAVVTCSHKECGREFATRWAEPDQRGSLPVACETSDKFDIGRNFCNKLWNAVRYACMNLEDTPCNRLDIATLPPEDRWILAKLSQTIRRYHACVQSYQYSASVKELREFFWDCLCDWYIELTKPRMTGQRGDAERDSAKQILAFCMDQILRLLHPTIPFITERLWAQLNAVVPRRGLVGIAELACDTALIQAAFPPVDGYAELDDDTMVATFAAFQDVTRGVRELRNNCNVPPRQKVTATVVVPPDYVESFQACAHIVRQMAGIGELLVATEAKRPVNAGSATVHGIRIYVHDISDDAAERGRTEKALASLDKQITGKERKLSNDKFLANAKPEVVEAERERLAQLLSQKDALTAHLAELADS